jgi:hypothetical protein
MLHFQVLAIRPVRKSNREVTAVPMSPGGTKTSGGAKGTTKKATAKAGKATPKAGGAKASAKK